MMLPKPYYKDPDADITIYHGDCLKIMPEFPDKSFDLVYADPPFNTKNSIGFYSKRYVGDVSNDNLSSEDYQRFANNWFFEARRISKKFVLTPGVGNIGLYPNPYWCIVISKPSSPSFNRFGGFNCWEPLFVYDKLEKGKRIKRDVIIYDSLNFIKDGREKHPCPDNHNMVNWILDLWSCQSGMVLDPFMGSGTTLVAAKELKRGAVGIEISEKYCEVAVKRLKNTIVPMF